MFFACFLYILHWLWQISSGKGEARIYREKIYGWWNHGTTTTSVYSEVTAEGRASVTPGNTETPIRADWKKAGVVSRISATRSLTGTNRANWDLR